ncbi:loricrin-like [Ostrea edulis]|uniref:loricrin-like n=1 Tax=Ostrea edulis TaxID=37623 RepID=UPI0024AFA11F|nr:loricrin-like [Ostrea edulis]
MKFGIIQTMLTVSSVYAGLNTRQSQCKVIPNICPQTCIITLGGCSHCVTSCATIFGASLNNHQSPSGYPSNGGSPLYNSVNGNGGGSQSSVPLSGGGGTSFLSPSSMNSYSSISGSSGLTNYNPGNLGPVNPYLNSGYGSSATGTNYNPANPGQMNGGVPFGVNSGVFGSQPSGYNGGLISGSGSQLPGNPAIPGSAYTTIQTTSTSSPAHTTGATQTCRPISCSDIKYIRYIHGCPECIIPSSISHTTIKPTTHIVTSSSTCAPLRCVAPCDKGIGIGPAGCPVCLCK